MALPQGGRYYQSRIDNINLYQSGPDWNQILLSARLTLTASQTSTSSDFDLAVRNGNLTTIYGRLAPLSFHPWSFHPGHFTPGHFTSGK